MRVREEWPSFRWNENLVRLGAGSSIKKSVTSGDYSNQWGLAWWFKPTSWKFSFDSVFGDFRQNHQLTKAHEYAQRISEGWKACQNAVVTICYLRRMLTREIQLDTHSGPVTLNPRWLRIPAAVKYSGLSRSRLYELLSEGRIRFICVKSQKWAQRGVRLINRESIDAFMEDQATAWSAPE